MSQLDPAALRQRQDFLRAQRDKLLALKKAAREQQLGEAARDQPKRPASARAARSALRDDGGAGGDSALSPEDQRKMAMRRAIAEKLRAEVVGKR